MGKRVCFIGGGLKGGGQERALTSLANYFADNGYKVSVVNLFRTEQFYSLKNDIEVFWPGAERSKHHRLIYALLIIPYLRSTLKKIGPDVLLSYGEWFNPFVIISTRLLGMPLFILERMGPELKMDSLVSFARKMLYRYATGVIVQTSTAGRIVAKNTGVKNIAVIPNPVTVIEADTSLKKKQIVTLGRLSPEKGHRIMILAFARLSELNWTLHIIGDGPERFNLEREAESAGVSDRVTFYGHVKDFSKILGESEIFVLPSFLEGFPNALIEAMSVPLACISSDCVAGPGDIIEDGINGLLVEPNNVDALTSALDRLINNSDLRKKLATEAYKVRETFAFDKVSQQYLDFIFRKNDRSNRRDTNEITVLSSGSVFI
jgi:glycosyltransferase involved in cell wall biosynthesis